MAGWRACGLALKHCRAEQQAAGLAVAVRPASRRAACLHCASFEMQSLPIHSIRTSATFVVAVRMLRRRHNAAVVQHLPTGQEL